MIRKNIPIFRYSGIKGNPESGIYAATATGNT
jgi:hypothetical protein